MGKLYLLSRLCRCAYVDLSFGNRGEFLVRFSFFVKSLLQNLSDPFIAEAPRESSGGSITCYFVVLDPLGGTDQSSIAHIHVPFGLDKAFPSLMRPFIASQVSPVGFSPRWLKMLLSRETCSWV